MDEKSELMIIKSVFLISQKKRLLLMMYVKCYQYQRQQQKTGFVWARLFQTLGINYSVLNILKDLLKNSSQMIIRNSKVVETKKELLAKFFIKIMYILQAT